MKNKDFFKKNNRNSSDFVFYALTGFVVVDVVSLKYLEQQNDVLPGRISMTSAVTDAVL